jgi:hypothetical protein
MLFVEAVGPDVRAKGGSSGNGLLWLSHSLIEIGGTVELIESTETVTAFEIGLPLAEDAGASAISREPHQATQDLTDREQTIT